MGEQGHLLLELKADLSCKMHFLMSFIHKYVSPVCQGPHAASENKTLYIFLRTQISKNGGTTELIQICVRYDVISAMQTHGPISTPDKHNNCAFYEKSMTFLA